MEAVNDEVWIPVWLHFLLLFSLLFFIIRSMIGARRRGNRLPPGPPKLPIIGNLHQLGGLPHRSLQQLSRKYGPLMLLQLGSVPTMIASSAETAREVLKTYDLECCSRPPLAAAGKLFYNYLGVAFSPYGKYWKEIRKICVLELFSAKRVQSFRFIREQEVAFMIDSISQSSSSGKPVNLSQISMSLNMEVICRIAFGKSFRDGGFNVHKFEGVVYDAFGLLGSFSASDFFPRVGWIIDRISGIHGRLERVFNDLDNFCQQVIDDHLRSERQKQEDDDDEDIIDVLLKIKENQTDSSALHLTHDHIKAILMDIFLAGIEPNAVVVTWAMAELARNPRVMKKAQEEIRNYVGKKGKVSENDLDQLQYFKLVVKEALRCHPPPTILLPRESRSQFSIKGYNFYPKTRIYVNAWAIGRDPERWENPDHFFPERFIDSPLDYKGHHFEFLPFGGGRRQCPGMNMGMFMVELALANLLYHFDWKLPEGLKEEDINMEETAGLTSRLKEALFLVPIKYQ